MMNKKVNTEAANEYMDKVFQESKFTSQHKGFTKVPHKLHRCYGLSPYEKLILIDLIAYMSNKNMCYPTIETIARNVGCSSKSIERHIEGLIEKKMIIVRQNRKNNTYYLPNYFHRHPYLLMSEKTYEFISSVRKQVIERKLTKWIQEILKEDEYKGFIAELQNVCDFRLPYETNNEIEILSKYNHYLKNSFTDYFQQ